MPKFDHHRMVETEAVVVDATESGSWTADADYIIKRIHLQNADGSGLTDSTFYLKIGEEVFTRPVAPALIYGPDVECTPELNLIITKGEKLDWTIKNREAATTTFLLTLEVWTP